MNDVSGILVLDKRAGISSAKAIAEIKRKLNLRKIGHAGTLDPAATGILVCLINGATKSASIFEGGTKTYEGTIKLGVTSDTDDLDGTVLQSDTEIPSFESIPPIIEEFIGEISQIPPSVSAIKLNGKRAYDIVRKEGKTPELKARQVRVAEFSVHPIANDIIGFRVVCSSGTYIRSLARDIGLKLGCGAALATLRRTGSLPFTIEHAVRIEDATIEDIKPLEKILDNGMKEKSCHLSS